MSTSVYMLKHTGYSVPLTIANLIKPSSSIIQVRRSADSTEGGLAPCWPMRFNSDGAEVKPSEKTKDPTPRSIYGHMSLILGSVLSIITGKKLDLPNWYPRIRSSRMTVEKRESLPPEYI